MKTNHCFVISSLPKTDLGEVPIKFQFDQFTTTLSGDLAREVADSLLKMCCTDLQLEISIRLP
jgi:hypothetical protein